MNVSLSPDLEQYIREKVESGLYQTASDVVREGLRLLEERDALRLKRVEELRREIQHGIEQADRGELSPMDARGTLERLRAERAKLGD